MKAAVHAAIKSARVPYTFVHNGGFFSYWVKSLGDLTKLGGPLPPTEVNVNGDGRTKGTFASLDDIAGLTIRALADPAMENRELQIAANPVTQDEMISLWQRHTGRSVSRKTVSAADLEQTIASATTPAQGMMLVVAQLHRSLWIRGEAVKRAPGIVDAQERYPDHRFQPLTSAW